MVDAEILAYYEHGQERDRLASGRQRIEFLRIWDLLERCLPAAPATVVDVGGGAGAYAIPLSRRQATRCTSSTRCHCTSSRRQRPPAAPALRWQASRWRRADLPLADDSADAVLLLGPLYHLTSQEDRVTALREARRILRPAPIAPEGVVAVLPSSRNSTADPPGDLEGLDDAARFLADGMPHPGGDPAQLTTSYFPTVRRTRGRDRGGCAWNYAALSPPAGASSSSRDCRRCWIPEARDHLLAVLRLLEAEPSLPAAWARTSWPSPGAQPDTGARSALSRARRGGSVGCRRTLQLPWLRRRGCRTSRGWRARRPCASRPRP